MIGLKIRQNQKVQKLIFWNLKAKNFKKIHLSCLGKTLGVRNSYFEKKNREKMQSLDLQTNTDQNSFKTPFFKKKFLKGYSKIHELKLVSIGLASPEKIQNWAEKELPNGKIFGEVTNANTFHYRTFQPTKGGLFCERIFGPLKDFECACGKRQKPTALESKKILEHKQTTRYFCSNCDVEYTWSIIRRYQLGYIKLNAPVTHLWYLKTNPSYLSIFFDMKRKDLEAIVYCTDSLTIENVWKSADQKTSFSGSITDLYTMWQKLQNFHEKKKIFQKYFQIKKLKKFEERNKFFSFSPVPKKDGFAQKNSLQNWKIFFHTPCLLGAHKNFFPHKGLFFDISQKIEQQKQQIFVSFVFQKILHQNLKKTSKNLFFTTIEKKFCFDFNFLSPSNFLEKNSYQQSIFSSFTNFVGEKKFLFCFNVQNFLFLKSFFLYFQKKKIENVFLSFFFLFQFSTDFCFKTKSGEKYLQKKFLPAEGDKKTFLYLVILVSFLKKQKRFVGFFSEKKEKKKFSFFSFFVKKPTNLKQLLSFLFETNLTLSGSRFEKILFSAFSPPISCEEGESVWQNPGWTETNQNLEKFFFSIKKIDFFNDEKRSFFPKREKYFFPLNKLENLNFGNKSSFRVSNILKNSKRKRIYQKKQKKQREFFQSCYYFEGQKKNSFDLQSRKIEKTWNCSGQKIKKKKNHPKQEKDNFLKNPIFTISSYFLWKNDSDWKYFVYYNSLFFSEFQDISISEQVDVSSFFFGVETKSRPFLSSQKTKERIFRGYKEKDQSFSFVAPSFQNLQKQTRVGAGILEKFFTEYTPTELKKMRRQHQIVLPRINQIIRSLKETMVTKKDSLKIQKYIQKREHIVRRLKFLGKFYRKNSNPTFMILRNLPVLPPDLRPILKLQNQIAASDLNRFYQRILYRNERLQKFSKDSATNQSFEMRYAQRLLQEAVDNLIQNGKGGVKPETNSRGIPLKSFSEILKGKQGRFRQYLLGKRVDYSGRSVIVVGPKLKLYECGLPKEMAFELFLPFLIQQILQLNLAKTVIGAKNILKKDADFAFHLLQKIMKNIPVLLNRAPTLHRLGFQAFLPKLIEGRAILLHPMVCPGFNADFDGDQMAVHVPLTVEARTEAWKFMLSTNNLMNSSTGDPILLPTQDMVLGCYYLTTDFYSKSAAVQILNFLRKTQKTKFYEFQKQNKNFFSFSNFFEVFSAYQRKEILLHSPVWIQCNAFVDFGNDSSKPIEIQIRKNGYWQQISPKIIMFSTQKNEIFSKFIRTTPGRIFMNFMIQEFSKNTEN